MVIVASSGMLTGGRVVYHLRELIDDPDALLLFVGYQGEGTLGAHLQAGRADGHASTARSARCAARCAPSAASRPTPTSPSCSTGWAHFARAPRRPRPVFLVHGDPEALDALEPRVRASV